MLTLKEFDLVRYSADEIVFKSRRDLVSALQELSGGNDIVVTYRDGQKMRSIIVMASVFTQFRSGEISIVAEQEITEVS